MAKRAPLYRCPRTRKPFHSKACYVAHLKKLATTNRKPKVEKALIQRLNQKIAVLCETARSYEDIGAWFSAHAGWLATLAVRLQFVNMATYKQERAVMTPIDVEPVSLSGCEQSNTCFFKAAVSPNIALHALFSQVPALYIDDVMKHKYDHAQVMFLELHASDWPFLAADILHIFYAVLQLTPGDDFGQKDAWGNAKTLLTRSFPSLSWDVFVGLVHSGLLPLEQADFKTWLFQHRPPNNTPVLATTVELPGCITD